MKSSSAFFVMLLSLSLAIGCGGAKTGAGDSPNSDVRLGRLITGGDAPPQQLVIGGYSYDASTEMLTVEGHNFDNGLAPELFLDAAPLTVTSHGATTILVEGVTVAQLTGNHLLGVSTGGAKQQYDSFGVQYAVAEAQPPIVSQTLVVGASAWIEESTGMVKILIDGYNFAKTPKPSVTVGGLPAEVADDYTTNIEATIDPALLPEDGDYLLIVEFSDAQLDRDAYILPLGDLTDTGEPEVGAICHPYAAELCWRNGPRNILNKKLFFQVLDDYVIDLGALLMNATRLPNQVNTPELRQALHDHLMTISEVGYTETGWDYISLDQGVMRIRKGYRWDGPSTPRINKKIGNMRASLIHDVFYDMMRMGLIPHDDNDPDANLLGYRNRYVADTFFYLLASNDGRGHTLAQASFNVLRIGGAPKTRLNNHDKWPWKFHSTAEAGPNLVLSCGPTTVELDGTASRYASIFDWQSVPFLPVPMGAWQMSITPTGPVASASVQNGFNHFLLLTDINPSPNEWWYDRDDLTITVNPDTEAPVLAETPDIATETDPGQCSAVVEFEVEATDECEGAVAVTCVPASGSVFPLGLTQVECTAQDSAGNIASSFFDVNVTDTEPPVVTGGDTPLTLWPPNHEIQTYWLSSFDIQATDNCDGQSALDVVFTSVTSNEPDNGVGDGNTTDDFEISEDGSFVTLRAERAGGGNGRVYYLNIEATDTAGNATGAAPEVQVPHDKR